MFPVLLAASFLLVATSSPVADNVEILLATAEAKMSTFKAALADEDVKSVLQVFDEMVKIDADLHQAIVLLKATLANPMLEAKVQVLIEKFDLVIPQELVGRSALLADIKDVEKGPETMRKLLEKLEK